MRQMHLNDEKGYNSEHLSELQYEESTDRTYAGRKTKRQSLDGDVDGNGGWANGVRAYEERN